MLYCFVPPRGHRLLVVKEGTMEVQLYSIHFNPFNSNEFCVGGRSRYVKVYDRRKVSRSLYKLRPSHMVCCIISESFFRFAIFFTTFIHVYVRL
jgi:hypothetical protein